MGFEVALACNGLEALSLFIERRFDLVLTDLEMPIMGGWGLTRHIKERSPSTPVVLMTGTDRGRFIGGEKRACRVGPIQAILTR